MTYFYHGGGWNNIEWYLRPSYRRKHVPSRRNDYLGFRLVRRCK